MWAAAANCASVFISTAGKILLADSGGSVRLTSAASIPLNAWWRLEGFCVGSATVGQLSFSIWTTSMDSSGAADETQTSAASFNTLSTITKAIGGCQTTIASVGPYWIDDLAISGTGAVGPVGFTAGTAPATGVPGAPVAGVTLNMTILGV